MTQLMNTSGDKTGIVTRQHAAANTLELPYQTRCYVTCTIVKSMNGKDFTQYCHKASNSDSAVVCVMQETPSQCRCMYVPVMHMHLHPIASYLAVKL